MNLCSLASRLIPPLLLLIASTMTAPARADVAPILVALDQATISKLPERVATIVIGNPLIADVSLQNGGQLVITGKGYGTTNVVALDRAGTVLLDQQIQVQGPANGSVVVVYRGISRESYSCTPNCERRITLGDAPEYFDATLGQAGTRNLRAQGAGVGAIPGVR